MLIVNKNEARERLWPTFKILENKKKHIVLSRRMSHKLSFGMGQERDIKDGGKKKRRREELVKE